MLVDRLSSSWDIKLKRSGKALWGAGSVSGKEIVLIKPQTYMNLSGEAVIELMAGFPVPISSILAAYDDCDLPLGKLRIRKNGGSGGHRGVESIIRHLSSKDFPRLRLGVGRPVQEDADIVDFVLSPFSEAEKELVDEMLERAAASIKTFLDEGIDSAMNKFN